MKTLLRLSLAVLVASTVACGDGETPTEPPVDNPPTIMLTAPNGGMAYAPGSTVEITWTATDDGTVTVALSYTADGGKSGSIATGESGSSFSWTTPGENLFGVKVKAVATDDAGQTAEDESDAIFAVVAASERGFVTSSVCQSCHAGNYEATRNSGHSSPLKKVENGMPPSYPFSSIPSPPTGYTWNDISYVIGGYGWKAGFLDQNGYVLTTGLTGESTQYNLGRPDLGLGSGWVAYHAAASQPEPFDCGRCHATGWQSTAENGGANQDGLVGIAGTWEEPGVTCEQCHGPGAQHVATKDAANIAVDSSNELCGSCHSRGGSPGAVGADGFILNYQQHNELTAAGHRERSCTDCHDPHIGTRYGRDAGGITATCESCHTDKTTNRHLTGEECVTCHMPRATRSAQSKNAYMGDVPTHIFKINAQPVTKATMFGGGATFLTLDFVCYQCHRDQNGVGGSRSIKTIEQLSARAIGIHN